MKIDLSLIAVARRFDFVRETEGPNRGLWVEYFLAGTGNVAGESWCASFVSKVIGIVYRGKRPIANSGSCDIILADARRKKLIVRDPLPGDLVFSMRGDADAHHIGIVTGIAPLRAIAGNTSADGLSDNGDGVYEHEISPVNKVFARLPATT